MTHIHGGQKLHPVTQSPDESDGESDCIVRVTGLVKYFGRSRALDGMDLTVRRGEIHGVLGPNGAGKTTLIKTLLGLLHPEAGQVAVLGRAPWNDAAGLHRRIAAVQGEVSLWPTLTGGEVIDLIAGMHGGVDHVRRDELLSVLQLDPGRRCHAYPADDRQKLGLIAALASESELLLLDEPRAGLTPAQYAAVCEWLYSDRSGDRTVVLASPLLAEVDIADRVTIIDRGHTLGTGTLADLRHLTRTAIVAELDRPDRTLARFDGVHNFELRRNTVRFDVDSDRLDSALRGLLACGLRSLDSRSATLEDLLARQSAMFLGASLAPAWGL
ncbi:MAG: ABC transporter ATP-binding protein [Mycobacteriaceae bacterium]|nr:ABC transporter ATP-binding protein [Mycobacteriaceae bacterium]